MENPENLPVPGKRPNMGFSRSSGVSSLRGGTLSEGGTGAFPLLQTGHELCGRFEIRKQIGIGGMGAVYRAYDRNQGDDIAIKVMLPELVSNEAATQRFINEAKISIKFSHQNIVSTYDVSSEGDLLFITMELLEGRSLRQDIEARKRTGRQYTEAEALAIVFDLCDALEYAHEFTVHRDIKPENVWLTNSGRVKLMDFGIARLLNGSQMGKSSAILGTAYYMAPEQLTGTREVDHLADQYALGVLLYEMLTGQVPTGRSKSVRQLRKDVSAIVSNAIDRALEPSPQDRFPGVRAFANALGGVKQRAGQTGRNSQTSASGSSGLSGWVNDNRMLVGVGSTLWSAVMVAGFLVHKDGQKQIQMNWAKWQSEMSAAFDKTASVKAAPEVRAKVWGKYLESYAADNPYSTEDEKLRVQATARKQGAEGEMTEAKLESKALARSQRDAPQRQNYQTLAAQQQVQQPVQQQYQPPPQPQARSVGDEAGLMILNRMLR